MFSLCAPCTRHYNAIIKMETFTDDSRLLSINYKLGQSQVNYLMCRHILSKTGQADSVYLSHSNNHGSQTITKEEIKSLFKGIPDSVIQELISRLRPDFEICGYTKTLYWIQSVLDKTE